MAMIHLVRRAAERLSQDPGSLGLRQRAVEAFRGLVNPTLVRLSQPQHYDLRRTLLVAGFPRSGTTWLAEVLSGIPGSGVIFEPLDIRRVHQARAAGFDWNNFIAPWEETPAQLEFMRRALSGRIRTAWTTSQLPVSRAARVDRWVVKLVRGNQMLGWVVENFDIRPPVLLVRHPCAVYDSWLRRGWPLRSVPPRPDLRFFSFHPEVKAAVEGLRSPEECFAAEWCMHHYAPLRHLRTDRYQLCFYEHLRRDGINGFRRIFDGWGLPLPDDLEQALVKPSSKASMRLRQGAPGWERRLGRGVVRRIVQVLERFEIDLYDGGPEPKR